MNWDFPRDDFEFVFKDNRVRAQSSTNFCLQRLHWLGDVISALTLTSSKVIVLHFLVFFESVIEFALLFHVGKTKFQCFWSFLENLTTKIFSSLLKLLNTNHLTLGGAIILLRTETGELFKSHASQYFKITQVPSEGFRFFRLRQRGVNHRGDHDLLLCAFEIFGTLFRK